MDNMVHGVQMDNTVQQDNTGWYTSTHTQDSSKNKNKKTKKSIV